MTWAYRSIDNSGKDCVCADIFINFAQGCDFVASECSSFHDKHCVELEAAICDQNTVILHKLSKTFENIRYINIYMYVRIFYNIKYDTGIM